MAEFTLKQTYMEIQAFIGFVGHYWWFIKGFTHIVQPLHKHLPGEGGSKKTEQVTLTVKAKDAFETIKRACMEAPVLATANFNKPFLLETDASKLGLQAVLSQKQADGWYHPVAYASQSLNTHECITINQWNRRS